MVAITFNGAKVHSIEMVELEDVSELVEEFTLDFSPAFSEVDTMNFLLKFSLKIVSVTEPSPFKLELQYYGSFDTESPIDEEFKASHFAHVNAPAIVYPYLRSYISMLTMISGFNTPMLGTCNFLSLYQDKQKIEQ